MLAHPQTAIIQAAIARARAGRLSRRQAFRVLGALGLTTTAAPWLLGRSAAASPGHSATHLLPAAQEGTPIASDAPEPGERADGSRLWRVKVAGMDMENLIDAQAFFPSEITINAGDTIYFEFPAMPGFHTVTFLSGAEVPAILVPDETAGRPSAGDPPKLILNPILVFPVGGDSYDGTGILSSGLDIFYQPGQSFVPTFTAPGVFDYLCGPHGAVMRARVVVQAAETALPHDQAEYDAMAAAEYAALIEEGKAEIAEYAQAKATARDDGTTLWEVAAGAGVGQARVLRFLPDALEIKAGDTVRWINRSVTEPHTVTFLGGEAQPEDATVESQADGPPKLVQSPVTLLPAGGPVFSGQGYVNSGFMGEGFPGIDPFELTFDTAGDHPYYCVLHASGPEGPGMAGRVTVSG